MDSTSACDTIRAILEAACGPDRQKPTEADLPRHGSTPGFTSNRMEKFWIKTLHVAFARHYAEYADVVVLSKAHRDSGWMRSEFLHDLSVVERMEVRSAYREHLLPVARRVLWQVESELSSDGRQVAVDFSKLVAGSAEGKLMVVRRPVDWQQDGRERICRFVKDMAVGCTGALFFAFLPVYSSSHGHLEAYWKADGPLPFDLFAMGDDRRMVPIVTAARAEQTGPGLDRDGLPKLLLADGVSAQGESCRRSTEWTRRSSGIVTDSTAHVIESTRNVTRKPLIPSFTSRRSGLRVNQA